jgi:BirA family biotin operon repressor/biotin-[acetyl-CoA-carboxylase] ligase
MKAAQSLAPQSRPIQPQSEDGTQRTEPSRLAFTLLRLLADGEFHSGEMLAQQLGISRASVSKALRDAGQWGVMLHRVRGRGYRVGHPLQWLDIGCISARLIHSRNFHVEILDHASSSNTVLLQRAALGAASGSVLAVEWQSSGRGRLGRNWHSGLGNALTFSLLWRFEGGPSSLSGLSLAAGVALIRGLRATGVQGASLKWPNDVLGTDGAKLAGILIEAHGDMLGPSAVVIGIGLNVSMPQKLLQQIGQPAISLVQMLDSAPDRNHLLVILLDQLHHVLSDFAVHGFAAVRAEWQSYHALNNHAVRLQFPDGTNVAGIARGVAEDGALELEVSHADGAHVRKYNVGEISLRGV